MKLEDFMTSVLLNSKPEVTSQFGITKIKQTANRIYKAKCVSPDFTKVHFDSSIVQMEQHRATHFNLLVRIMPGHPYFRPWLKLQTMRYTEPLYLLELRDGAPQYSPCGQPVDAELNRIVETIETRITDRVTQFEQSIRTLNRITNHYGLQSEDMSALMEATDYLVKHATHDRDFFLNTETRTTLLPE